MQTPKEQNTFQLHRIKTVNTRKTKGSNAYRESHGVAGGEGAGAPAPTAAGSSVSTPYRAWPWARGRGCPSPRHVSEYPEVEERQGALEQTDSTVPARLWALRPEAMVQAAVSSREGSCCHQAPLTAQRQRGCPRGLSLPAARPAAPGRGGDRLRPFRGQIQGTSMFLQSMKMNQLCPTLAF